MGAVVLVLVHASPSLTREKGSSETRLTLCKPYSDELVEVSSGRGTSNTALPRTASAAERQPERRGTHDKSEKPFNGEEQAIHRT